MGDYRVLVVDDPAILSALIRGLRIGGYAAVPAEDAGEALAAAHAERPSAVILDRMLPDQDGLETCKQLRALGDFPILMLTARDAIVDRVAGLDSGAEDYLVKPFALAELLARLRAILRRVPTEWGNVLRYADVTMDLDARMVWRGDRQVELRPREYELLSGGHVVVQLSPTDDMVEVTVSDSGVGIAPEHHPRIFERFYRVDPARSRRSGGSGLGLAIVKYIVEAHGGTVRITSEPGQGATSSLRLPLRTARTDPKSPLLVTASRR